MYLGSYDLTSNSERLSVVKVTTIFENNGDERDRIERSISPDIPLYEIPLFVCGYGCSFGTIGSEIYEKYERIEAVYSLFNYSARLQNPENALFRVTAALDKKKIDRSVIFKRIDQILMLPDGSTKLDYDGLKIANVWGDSVSINAIGDGHAATVTWICDLLGWYLLAKQDGFDQNLQGIVLLDEIERHLHPVWQRQIIQRLSKEFPEVQFIVTTHAPLVAISTTSLRDDCCRLVRLREGMAALKFKWTTIYREDSARTKYSPRSCSD